MFTDHLLNPGPVIGAGDTAMGMMGSPSRERGTESGNGGGRSPRNICQVLKRRCEQGNGSGEGPAMPGEAWETRALCYFRGVDTGRCASFPPKAVGTRWLVLSLLEVPQGELSVRHPWAGIPGSCGAQYSSRDSPSPAHAHGLGWHLSGWMESPAWDESGEMEPQAQSSFPPGPRWGPGSGLPALFHLFAIRGPFGSLPVER